MPLMQQQQQQRCACRRLQNTFRSSGRIRVEYFSSLMTSSSSSSSSSSSLSSLSASRTDTSGPSSSSSRSDDTGTESDTKSSGRSSPGGENLLRLAPLLPGVNLPRAARANPLLLTLPPPAVVAHLVRLRSLLPSADVLQMVDEVPALLTDTDLSAKLCRSIDKLHKLCPTRDVCSADAEAILEANPSLIYRLESYEGDFNSLPIDVQNILVIAGGGAGESHASWRRDELTFDDDEIGTGTSTNSGDINTCS